MRNWSLHPKYPDTKGLVALWRETSLTKYVFQGNIKGYKKIPVTKSQLEYENLHLIKKLLNRKH